MKSSESYFKKTSFILYLIIGVFALRSGSRVDGLHKYQLNPKPYILSGDRTNWVFLAKYSDEFNETQLDTSKWNDKVPSWGVWSWKPENVYLDNGWLYIKMQYSKHKQDGEMIYYTSGIVRSNSPIRYGYFEAKIRAAKRFPGVCPAFWAYNQEKNLWTEIDFAELTQHQDNLYRIDLTAHAWRHPKLKEGNRPVHKGMHVFILRDPRAAFHIYGCEWDSSMIRWYIDGTAVDSTTNEYWRTQKLYIVLSMGVREPLYDKPSQQGFPTEMAVDYIRAWEK